MAYRYINFRNTAGYVTDGVNDIYCLPTDIYPTTRGGITFGWPGAATGSDRRNNQDVRLAGYNGYTGSGTGFLVQLPNGPGVYNIRYAAGHQATGVTRGFKLFDSADLVNPLVVVAETAVATNSFLDATGAVLSAAAWPAGNAPVQITCPSGYLYVTKHTSGANFGIVSLGIENVPSLNNITSPNGRAAEGMTDGAVIGDLSGYALTGGGMVLTNNAGGRVALVSGQLVATSTAITYDPDNPTMTVEITETQAGYLYSPRVSTIVIPIVNTFQYPTAPPADIWPGPSYNRLATNNGAGSGFDVTNPIPVDPSNPGNAAPKPTVHSHDFDWEVITEDKWIGVMAFAKDDIKRVECHMEGRVATETSMRRRIRTDSMTGNAVIEWGYFFNVDWSAFPGDGAVDVYYKVVPNNPAFLPRVIGPVRMIRAATKHDAIYTVNPGAAVSSTNFHTVAAAIYAARITNGHKRPGIKVMANITTTDVSQVAPAGSSTPHSTMQGWIDIWAEDGFTYTVAQNWRSDPIDSWRIAVSGLRFGKNVVLDTANWMLYVENAASYYNMFDGCVLTNSYGMTDLYRGNNHARPVQVPNTVCNFYVRDTEWNECTLGPVNSTMIRNIRINNCGGDVFTNCLNIYGAKLDGVGAEPFRELLPAFTINQYTGSATTATVEKVGGNGASESIEIDSTKVAETVTVNATTDLLTTTQNWLAFPNHPVRFTGTALPGGLAADTTYYLDPQSATTAYVKTTSTYVTESVTVNATTDVITVTKARKTGDIVRVAGTALPGGLSAGTNYYVIYVSATTIKLATSSANASAGTAIDITSAGTDVKLIPAYVDLTSTGTAVKMHPYVTAGLIFRLDGDVALAVPFSGYFGWSNYWPSEVAAAINAKGGGLSATLAATPDVRCAIFLSQEGSLQPFAPVSIKTAPLNMVAGQDTHGDISQFTTSGTPSVNVAHVNVKAVNVGGHQNIFLTNPDGAFDFAFINWCTDNVVGNTLSQLGSATKQHVLLWHHGQWGQKWAFRGPLNHCDIRNCVWYGAVHTEIGAVTNTKIDRMLVVIENTLPSMATNVTTGVGDVDTIAGRAWNEYSPRVGGALYTQREYPLVPFDIDGRQRETLSAIGPYEYTGHTPLPKGKTTELTKTQFDAIKYRTTYQLPGTHGPIGYDFKDSGDEPLLPNVTVNITIANP